MVERVKRVKKVRRVRRVKIKCSDDMMTIDPRPQ